MMLSYVCNVCSSSQSTDLASLDRETGMCVQCGSFVRTRATTHLISCGLFGRSLPVPQWPSSPHIRGVGVSDWPGFAEAYPRRVNYTNTRLHRSPVLDVRDPPAAYRGVADFVSCSDVLEHVTPPVAAAFDGLFAILKPGGLLVLTVPYGFGETVEHFPDLHDWKIEAEGSSFVLTNTTADGRAQAFRDLCFHGGPGQVVEMRLFGLADLKRQLSGAGFTDVEVFEDEALAYGVRMPNPWSRPITARRPAG